MHEEVFHTRKTTAGASAILAVGIFVCSWGFGIFGHNIDLSTRVAMIGGGTFVAVFSWRDALLRIRVRESELIAEYVLRRRVIPYAAIENMNVEEEVPIRGIMGVRTPPKDVIVLRRRRGPAVALRNFDDDVAAPFGALQRSWSAWMDRTMPGWRSSRYGD